MDGFRKNVSENVAKLIRGGVSFWKIADSTLCRMAKSPISPPRAVNPVTGKRFNGINSIILGMEMAKRASDDPRFMTRYGAEAAGYEISEDAKGINIERWLSRKSEVEEVAYSSCEAIVSGLMVYHASDIEGIKPYKSYLDLSFDKDAVHPHDAAESMLERAGIEIVNDQTKKSFYDKETDKIHMPSVDSYINNKDGYKGKESYLASALYHVGEGVLHKMGIVENIDLRAQVFSSLVSSEIGIESPSMFIDFKDHADFIENDHNAIFRAAYNANRAAIWVNEPEKRQSIEMETKDEVKRMAGEIDLKEKDVHHSVYSQFEDFIREQGLDAGRQGPIMDGRWHKVPFLASGHLEGDEGRFGGSYRGSLNGPIINGDVSNKHMGDSEIASWVYTGEKLDSSKVVEMVERWEKSKFERVDSIKKQQWKAAAEAQKEMGKDSAIDATRNNCVFFMNERLNGYNVKQDEATGKIMVGHYDIKGNLNCIQYIDEEGETFTKGAKREGCFHTVDPEDKLGKGNCPVIITSNYLDAVSVYEATGHPAISLCRSRDVINVVHDLRHNYSFGTDIDIVVALDRDQNFQGVPVAWELRKDASASFSIPGEFGLNVLRKTSGEDAVHDLVQETVEKMEPYKVKCDRAYKIMEKQQNERAQEEQVKKAQQEQGEEAGMDMEI